MNSLKTKIKNHFDKASHSYETVASIQKQSAEFLIEKLLEVYNSHPQTILDLGTGTGYVSELLLKYYPKSTYTLNDIAPKMLEICSAKFANHNNCVFTSGDMENINFTNHQLVISNLALQWVNDLWQTLNTFHQRSNVLAFSCLLNETFHEWRSILHSYDITSTTKQYPQEQEMITYCNKLGGTDGAYTWTKNFHVTFPNYFNFMQYLKNLGANTNIEKLPFRVLRQLVANHNSELTVTYKVFFGILKR